MTIASETNRVSYAGNGVTVAFAFAAPYRASTDFDVTLRVDATGVEAAKSLTTHYTIAGAANTGTGGFDSMTLTMLTAPATGETLVINRKVPPTTSFDATAGAAVTAPNLEGALDRAMLAIQGLQEQINRAPLLPKSSPLSSIALPNLSSAVAGDYLAVNATGDGWTLSAAAVESATVSPFMATVLDDLTATAALATLGLTVTTFAKTLLDDTTIAALFATLGFLTGTASVNFNNASDNTTAAGDVTITVTGIAVGDFVLRVTADGDINTTLGAFVYGKATSANTVTVYLQNDSGGAFNAAAQNLVVLALKKSSLGL